MAFTPEDGTGIATANSFIDLDAADAYHNDRGNAAWAAVVGETSLTVLGGDPDATADTFSFLAAHSLATGQRVTLTTSAADLPSGLQVGVFYYVIVMTATAIRLATTRAFALAGTQIGFDEATGTGTHTVKIQSEKEGALVRATSYLDLVYGDSWIGEKADDANPLSWPRVNAYLWPRGDSVPSENALDAQVPGAIKNACAEIALRLAAGTDLLPDSSAGVVSSQSITLPGMSRSVVYAEPGALPNMPIVDRLLAPYVRAPEVYRR